jgi:hypothetical protein
MFCAAVAGAAVIAGIGYYTGGHHRTADIIVSVLRRAVAEHRTVDSTVSGSSSAADSNFTLTERGNTRDAPFVWSWIEVLNEDTAPLTVNAIILNGEFPAQPGVFYVDRVSLAARNSAAFKPLPQTLSIGEEFYAVECVPGDYPGVYPKQVILIDIYTNRGNFRYRYGQMTSESPPPIDTVKMAAIEEVMRVDGEKADAKRAEQIQEITNPVERYQPTAGGGGNPANH